MKRYGQIIGIDIAQKELYLEAHKNCWPDVKKKLTECNIHNYSIFLRGEFLFAYFEYFGEDFDEDMKKMAADPVTQQWWDLVGKAQKPLEDRAEGEWWASMDEVFHMD